MKCKTLGSSINPCSRNEPARFSLDSLLGEESRIYRTAESSLYLSLLEIFLRSLVQCSRAGIRKHVMDPSFKRKEDKNKNNNNKKPIVIKQR